MYPSPTFLQWFYLTQLQFSVKPRKLILGMHVYNSVIHDVQPCVTTTTIKYRIIASPQSSPSCHPFTVILCCLISTPNTIPNPLQLLLCSSSQ